MYGLEVVPLPPVIYISVAVELTVNVAINLNVYNEEILFVSVSFLDSLISTIFSSILCS